MSTSYPYPYAAVSDVGRVRDHNEDSILAQPPLFVVADGMGGHEAGEIASNIAIEQMRLNAPHAADAGALMRAARKANNAIIKAAREGIGKPGMGTTLTAALIRDDKAVLAQVGDSRAYVLRSGRLMQMTEDHSVVAAMVRSGSLSADDARIHPRRNVITRALGSDENTIVDTYEYETLRGDRWLLCSDGLSGALDDTCITDVLTQTATPREATRRLIDLANEAGGSDNISAIVIDIDRDPGETTVARTHNHKGIAAVIAGIVCVLALFIGLGTFLVRYARSQAYIAPTPSGRVGIYRGVPGSVLGYSISTLSTEATFTTDQLAPLDRQKVESGEDTYDSLAAARSAFATYRSHIETATER